MVVSTGVPRAMASMANAETTAAAGAQGAEISRWAPPKLEATMPMATAPRMPARAPSATWPLPSTE
jgi:hypothetical protein